MKVLRGTAAWIEGKKYKEGYTIPQKYEKEFEKYLVDVPDLPALPGAAASKDTKETASKDKK